MSSLNRLLLSVCLLGLSDLARADELLRDLEELYGLTSQCEEKAEVALRWGMVLRQSPMPSQKRQTLLESVYSRALEPCASEAIRAQAVFELGIVSFGNGQFRRAKDYFVRLLNEFPDDLLVVDSLYWLAESYSELGDSKRARRAYLGVAERSVGEMKGWGLLKSSRLTKSKAVSVRSLVRLLELLSVSEDISSKFKRAIADAFVADWSRATNQIRGGVRKHRRWRRLDGGDAALLMRSMGRFYIATSKEYAAKSLLASLKRLNVAGWDFEKELWQGLLDSGNAWLSWFEDHPQILVKSLSEDVLGSRLAHLSDVLEIAVGRSSKGNLVLTPEQLSAIKRWALTGEGISSSDLFALVKLNQLGSSALEGEKSPLPDYLEALISRCLEDDGRRLNCSAGSLGAILDLWSSRRSTLERVVDGSQAFLSRKKLWELLRVAIEGRRLVVSREEELATLLEFAVVFEELEGFTAYASLIPDDYPDSNCVLTRALLSVDREDLESKFWSSAQTLLTRLSEQGLQGCEAKVARLQGRIGARLDLAETPGNAPLDSLIEAYDGRAGLSLVLIEAWRRLFEAGNLNEAQARMKTLLDRHGSESEVRSIATQWGDWLERNNNWLRAAEHYQRMAQTGGKAIGFYALSKAGRAYRLAGESERSAALMRQAQERAEAEMNGLGLEKICDYWWRQWTQGDESAAQDVLTCELVLLGDGLGDRCESLVRVFSLPPRDSGAHPSKNAMALPVLKRGDCQAAKWESFLAGVRRVIDALDGQETLSGLDEAEVVDYLADLEATRQSSAREFEPYLAGQRPVLDALALAYYYGRLHEALFDGLMKLDDPSLGTGQAALWRRELSRRGEPLRSIALSGYQKALALRSPEKIHPLETSLQEALLRLEALSTQPALDYLPLPGEQ